jgi:transcription elongation factor Elf1
VIDTCPACYHLLAEDCAAFEVDEAGKIILCEHCGETCEVKPHLNVAEELKEKALETE